MARGYGEGTWRKLASGNWQLTISAGTNRQGERIRISGTGKTKKEARERANQKLDQLQGFDESEITVAEWADIWLEEYKRPNINSTTYLTYEHQLRNHFIEPLGDFRLRDLTTIQLQTHINTIDKNHSRALARAIKSRITSCLKKAVDIGLIDKNPAIGTELSKTRNNAVRALTKEEQDKLVDRCRREEYANIILFLLTTGLRIGEATGLTWDNVDLKNRTLVVAQIMVEEHGNPRLQPYPKTDNSVRTVPLSGDAYAILKERERNNDPENNVLNLVFYSSTFNFRTLSNFRRYFDRMVEEAGIERKLTPHMLRHTFATRLIEQGANIKAVSQLLGHAKVTTTLNIYTEVFDDEKIDVIDTYSIL